MSGFRVLHIDDEPGFPEMVADFLELEDDRLAVETAHSPTEWQNQLETSDFDCVISDFDMPEMDGIELLREIRKDCPDLPVILFTGKGSEEVASEAITAGVTHYLQKDSGSRDQFTVLANRVTNAAEKYQAQKKFERQRDLFQKVQENAKIGAWEHDLESGELRWTDQVYEIHDAPKDFEPTVDRVAEFYHEDDLPKLREAVDKAINQGEGYDIEARMVGGDNGVRWVRSIGEPQVENGEVVRVLGTVRDITAKNNVRRVITD